MNRRSLIVCILISSLLICGCAIGVTAQVQLSPAMSPQPDYANATYVPAPEISVSPNPGLSGRNVTVTGQHFTPYGTASLYGIPKEVYTSNVDKNGNTSWAFIESDWWTNSPIYALDGNYTNGKSNTITLIVNPLSPPAPLNDYPPAPLNDYTPTPTPTPAPSPFLAGLWVLLTVCVAALMSMSKERS